MGVPFPVRLGYLKIQKSVRTVQERGSFPLSQADAVCWLRCTELGDVQGCWNLHPPTSDAREAQRLEKLLTDRQVCQEGHNLSRISHFPKPDTFIKFNEV